MLGGFFPLRFIKDRELTLFWDITYKLVKSGGSQTLWSQDPWISDLTKAEKFSSISVFILFGYHTLENSTIYSWEWDKTRQRELLWNWSCPHEPHERVPRPKFENHWYRLTFYYVKSVLQAPLKYVSSLFWVAWYYNINKIMSWVNRNSKEPKNYMQAM